MDKKLYALRNGENSGIYLDWLSFFEKIDGKNDVEYKIFLYKEELNEADESVIHSMKWALREAKEYLNSSDEPVEVSSCTGETLDDFKRIIRETEAELEEELRMLQKDIEDVFGSIQEGVK